VIAVRTAPGLPLTGREREVARLVASGLTNRQIASRLSLSVRTVECHLWSAYAKTGTGTRTRLMLWLIRQGEYPGPEMKKAGDGG
jgi:DNA-binding NarL/FixJ family response regulator